MNKQAIIPAVDFNTFLHNNLNDNQRQAVTHKEGSILVVAGAGSGKTRVITARIAHLILNDNVSASTIIALTFTNKAAQEMRQRIASFLPPHIGVPFVGTFHAYCLRMLKQYSALIEQPFTTILDMDDAHMIIEQIIKRNGLHKKISAKNVQHQISLYKNQLHPPSDSTRFDPFFMQMYAAYEQEKRMSKCIDFDDLLLYTLQLFKKNESFGTQFRQKIRHILVDEYQDTNTTQHDLLKCMSRHKNVLAIDSLCAVGDEDQSIYSWRGATISNIINFTKDFPNTTIIKIEQNYRSNQSILDAANALITHNKQRTPKQLWSTKIGKDRIRHFVCNSEYQEADACAAFFSWIARNKPTATCAIVYRAHFLSRALEEALIKNSLAYTIIGGIQFYERKEIKDLLAYLRLACNNFDRISFMRTINSPTRGLGDKCIEQLQEQWQLYPHESCIALAKKSIENKEFPPARLEALRTFVAIFDTINGQSTASTALEHIIAATHYHMHIKKQYDQNEAKERIENIQELIRAVQHMEQLGISTIAAFLDEVTLIQEKHDAQAKTNPIYLMTLHAAKGLEFDYVAITGLQEGILPNTRSSLDANALEEERRLFYVGITRAQEYLLLLHAVNRYTYGTLSSQTSSRFLAEIPAELLNSVRCVHMSTTEMNHYMHSWLSTTKHTIATPVLTFQTASHKKPTNTPAAKKQSWNKNQLVEHEKFGVGMITAVESRGEQDAYITVKFKRETKKISAQFLRIISHT